MLPLLLIHLLPIPSALLLSCLGIYHLLPLLTLIPSLSHSKLLSIIPHPRRNLPREFFNLPPRPGDDDRSLISVVFSGKLGIRGKLVLILVGSGLVSLGCGWGLVTRTDYERAGAAFLALSTISLPSVVLWLSFFAITRGIAHSTLVPRILPFSLGTTLLSTVLAVSVPNHSQTIILIILSLIMAGTISICLFGAYNRGRHQKPICLAEPEKRFAPGELFEEMEERVVREGSDWLTSPSQLSTATAFSYSPSVKTPKNKQRPPGSPDSWLSSPNSTPSTLPSWSYSPSIASPEPAITRERSASPALPQPTPHQSIHGSGNTSYTPYTASTPGSALSPGGSILADYEPDPFHPLPRRFESLTSYPVSPSQMMAGSRLSLTSRACRSHDTLAFAPNSKTSSTFTLETFHSASETLSTERRAPPPPPIPVDIPLPPTPTASHNRSWEWQGKESTELLMGERDWVEVDRDVDGIAGWGEGGRGIGVVGLTGIIICYGLTIPILVDGFDDVSVILYLISLIIPSPLLALASYLLRYRQTTLLERRTEASTAKPSIETHRSLALVSASQLSLPISISPKLTPPAPNRSSTQRLSKTVINPKPSVSNFGYVRPERPHTVYGDGDGEVRRTMARRSGDVWIESGHAREGGSILSRAAEMLKPVPAMRVLGSPQPDPLTRFRGGVVSMLPKRISGYFESATSEVEIKITSASPTKLDRRESVNGSDYAEIQTATRARMSSSPSFVIGAQTHEYELDWLSAGILPGLVPNIKIGNNVRVESPHQTPKSQKVAKYIDQTPKSKHVSLDQTPTSKRRSSSTHGYSSSIDHTHSQEYYTANQSTPSQFRHRRKSSTDQSQEYHTVNQSASTDFQHRHRKMGSLPTIDTVDFTDIRRSFEEYGRDGLDLPPFPVQVALTPVTEEGSSAGHSASRELGDTESEEEMAEEMERVMAMDTPTRTSFVISPPPTEHSSSSYRTSQSGQTSFEEEVPPVPVIPESYMVSHPHPPPITRAISMTFDQPIPRAASQIIEPHPPVFNLASKQSFETIRSESTTDTDPSPTKVPAFQPSKKELMLVKQLQSRAEVSGNTRIKKTSRKGPPAPLRLVDINTERPSQSIPMQNKKSKGKPMSVLDGTGGNMRDKEDMKTPRKSKPFAGAGISGIRV